MISKTRITIQYHMRCDMPRCHRSCLADTLTGVKRVAKRAGWKRIGKRIACRRCLDKRFMVSFGPWAFHNSGKFTRDLPGGYRAILVRGAHYGMFELFVRHLATRKQHELGPMFTSHERKAKVNATIQAREWLKERGVK